MVLISVLSFSFWGIKKAAASSFVAKMLPLIFRLVFSCCLYEKSPGFLLSRRFWVFYSIGWKNHIALNPHSCWICWCFRLPLSKETLLTSGKPAILARNGVSATRLRAQPVSQWDNRRMGT